jgi:phosphonate transport system substrate-binding protein
MPQWFLYQNGVNVATDITNVFVGSQESSIANVAIGAVDVGVTWPPPWAGYQKSFPDLAAKLKIIWKTPSLVNNGLVAYSEVPLTLVKTVARALFTLDKTEEGKKILADIGYAGFEPATIATYQPVEEFLKSFTAKVRDPFKQIK